MFDITATNDIQIASFDGHISNTQTTYQIYYKVGTWVGFENNPGAWTELGTATFTPNGLGQYSAIPIPVNLTIHAGQTYAFYLMNNGAVNYYHNGSSVGAVSTTDANLTVFQGAGLNSLFGLGGNVFTTRVWEGRVNYLASPLPSYSIPPGATFSVGTTTVNSTVSDGSGNSASCSFTVTVNDNEAPVITCPANIVANMDPGQCGAVVTFAGAKAATATDNCGATITYSPASGTFFNLGTTTVTATADDGHGNTDTCTFTVTVNLLNLVNLQWPPSLTICQGSSFTAYGQVYEPNVTNLGNNIAGDIQGANIEAQFGYNTSNTDPSTWSSWSSATFNAQADWNNNNEYFFDFTPPTNGTFYYTFRFRQNGCGDWQYGGYSVSGGGFWDGTNNVSGTVTVDPTTVGGAVSGGTSPICTGFAPGNLTLSGNIGAVLQWESYTTGPNWTPISNITNTYTPGNLTQTTTFRAVVQSGTCLVAYSTPRTITVYQQYPFYADTDNDGYGAGPVVSLCSINGATAPAGYRVNNTDCDDTKADRNQTYPFYVDADNDTFGKRGSTPVQLCAINAVTPPLPNYSVNSLDCNDLNASIRPNAVEIPYDNIDQNCDGSLIDGRPLVVLNITSHYCGSTNFDIDKELKCTKIDLNGRTHGNGLPHGLVVGYRFEITNMATGQVFYVDTNKEKVRLTDTDIYTFGTWFTIRAGAIIAGEFQGFNGTTCTVKTEEVETSKVKNSQCGSTLSMMNSKINAEKAKDAKIYRFRIALASAPGVYYYYENDKYDFKLTDVPGLPLTYETEYLVDIQVFVRQRQDVEGWSLYGPVCSIFTPPFPETAIKERECDYYENRSISSTTTVNADSFPGATMYRFNLIAYDDPDTPLVNEDYNQVLDRTVPNFKLNMFTGLTPNTTYTISVSMLLYGNWVPPGKDCSLTTTANPREGAIKADTTFKAAAYPNPFANNFMIDVKSTSTSVVNLKVYDMVGRLVEQRSVNVTELENSTIGERYPSGVYNVVVTQDNEIKTVRVVKR